jgi:hypothetical protein
VYEGKLAAIAETEERLTRPPGLLWGFCGMEPGCSPVPQPWMTIAAGLAVIGTLWGRSTEGPTHSPTHLYSACITASGAGKSHPAECARLVMEEVGAGRLVLPGTLRSGQGFLTDLQKGSWGPLGVAFWDEFSDVQEKMCSGNTWMTDGKSFMKKMWNPFDVVDTGSTVDKPSVRLIHPCVSMLTTCTEEPFYRSMRSEDLTNGYLARFGVFPGNLGRLGPMPEVVAPKGLVAELKRLTRDQYWRKGLLDQPLLSKGQPVPEVPDRMRLGWGPGAEAAWEDYRQECFAIAGREAWVVGNRNAEKAVRMATCVALGCGEPVVGLEAVRWGIAVARLCYAEIMRGIERYSMAKLAQPDFTGRVEEYLLAEGGRATQTALSRRFRKSIHNNELDRALRQLQDEGRLQRKSEPTSGRSREWWILVREGDEAS